MLFTRSFVSLLSFVALVVAEPLLSPHVLHEKRSHTPAGWSRSRKHDADAVLPLRIGLTQSNMDKLEELLLDVSEPSSPNFGKHWNAGKVAQTFKPSSETVSTVYNWLAASGIDASRIKVSKAKTWIEVNATVTEAEQLLQTEYHVYTHESGKEHVACEAYHVPKHVSKHVDIIMPSIHFDAVIKRSEPSSHTLSNIGQPGVGLSPKSTGKISDLLTQLEDCDQQITPICLRALYDFVYYPVATSKNSYGIVEYTPQAYLQSDLDLFFKNFSTNQVGKSPVEVSIDGGYAQTDYTGFGYNGESNLDLQYGMALTDPQPITLYQTGDMEEGASFNNFLDAIDGSFCTFEGGDDPYYDAVYPDPYGGYDGPQDCGITKPAYVISTSYAYNEADLSPAYAARQCAEYAKLGLMGTTVLYSSGDNGVAGNSDLCLGPDGDQSYDAVGFNPSFPGTCPYITSVGATQVVSGHSVYQPESACMEVIYSGGGFSNYFAMPSYQKSAVDHYLSTHPPKYSSAQYNTTGKSRGFPDLSANGAFYVVAVDGSFESVFGTSASSPVVGTILTSINDARLAIGKGPIGFINPTIYSSEFTGAFNDITNGTNPGCGTVGFSAEPGWDPVTGLGTPNFAKLLARWLLV
ncbi:subtilisin-like protein [Neolentinus lepideus HHB14362 ss-1]|uniref:tripeptidyl-peptidase II n=1 Tax=Neolentinus lepideus HHB14362 ss-1 TaxID=1314782 RepID=A0A165QVL0_9AGAM|nr:subtilisin-like protein [Neolentinus lepideus HHB14362 ss-1]